MRSALATVAAAALALGAFAGATDGLRAFTAEGARRLAVLRSPRPVPDLELEDALGRRARFEAFRGRRLCVVFVYTRCPTVCRRMTSELGELAERLRSRGAVDRAALLSVSFDTAHDSPEQLRAYASLYAADGELWRFARAREPAALARWLEIFGVVVIPDGEGGFVHNAALHLVDERGRLARILDLGALDEAERFLVGS